VFERETVFVLGAGASWHYCYPTGEELVLDVIDLAWSLNAECQRHLKKRHFNPPVPSYFKGQGYDERILFWTQLELQTRDLALRLETVRPIVIDYFLGWNPSLRDVGKLLIAGVILNREFLHFSKGANANRQPNPNRIPEGYHIPSATLVNLRAYKDNWYRFVTHKLVSKCTSSNELLTGNRVHFVTFNYDYSLETHLFNSLSAIDIFEESDIRQFISERILHVYGCIRSAVPTEAELSDNDMPSDQDEARWVTFLGNCWRAAQCIRTIDNHDKVHEPFLEKAKGWVAEAQVGYILGYGFDETNSERIDLHKLMTSPNGAQVYFTNFKNANSINKRAGTLVGHQQIFLERNIFSNRCGTFERSERDVYEALELDFGSFN
jgi:hypothetical protein